jgi:hypothetical protein
MQHAESAGVQGAARPALASGAWRQVVLVDACMVTLLGVQLCSDCNFRAAAPAGMLDGFKVASSAVLRWPSLKRMHSGDVVPVDPVGLTLSTVCLAVVDQLAVQVMQGWVIMPKCTPGTKGEACGAFHAFTCARRHPSV